MYIVNALFMFIIIFCFMMLLFWDINHRSDRLAAKNNQLDEMSKKDPNLNNIIIPVFSMERFEIDEVDVAGHEQWWMEIAEDGLHFYRKKFLSRKVETFSIGKNERKWYFKDNWKCLELFDLNGPEENIIRLFKKPERKLAFVVSREYEAIFTDVTAGMGAIDYNALKAKLTEERRIHMEKDNKAFYAITQ